MQPYNAPKGYPLLGQVCYYPLMGRWPDGPEGLRGRCQSRPARLGELALELGSRRVAVIHMQRVAVGGHHHGRGQRVDVKSIGESAFGDRVDLVDAHVAQSGERRILVRATDSAALAGEIKDVGIAGT